MKIALCVSECVLGGVAQSTSMLAHQFGLAGHAADILVTGKSAGEYAEELRRRGVSVIATGEGLLWLRRRIAALAEALRGYDAVLNTHSEELQILAPAVAPDTVLINVIRNTVCGKSVLKNEKYFNAHVAISPAVAEHLILMGAQTPIHVIPNAVELTSERMPEPGLPLKILYLGRFDHVHKNVRILPEIFRRLAQTTECRMVLAGDGPEKNWLENEFREEVRIGTVHFAGSCSRQQTAALLSESNFLLVPSRFEAFGLIVAEGMATGAVPVTSNLPAFMWILGPDAEDLQVTDNNSPAEYVEKIAALAADPDKYRAVQARLLIRQRERFVPPKTAAQYIRIAEMYLNERETVRPVPYAGRMSVSDRVRCTLPYYLLQIISGKRVRQ
jgi:glycosyltransferase involved in cell wall biosynthesis